MFKIILGLFLSLNCIGAFAFDEYFEAVLRSEAAKEIADEAAAKGYVKLLKVENSSAQRCMGCFEFVLTFESFQNQEAVEYKLQTRKFGDIIVTRKN